jgi:hypothetical protein
VTQNAEINFMGKKNPSKARQTAFSPRFAGLTTQVIDSTVDQKSFWLRRLMV